LEAAHSTVKPNSVKLISTNSMPTLYCPLCLNADNRPFDQDKRRDYYRCRRCHLVFVPPHQQLAPEAEKAIYDLHQNGLDDTGYRQFLSRLTDVLALELPANAYGLDYGCGPGPLLAQMLTELGHTMQVFDPYYADRPENLLKRYDVVTCTEVVEHFHQPQLEFQRLFGLVKPNGILAIMTKLVIDQAAFSRWHYKNDLTHISFFSEATFAWLAGHFRCDYRIVGKDVILLRKTINASI
jgi:SAM-dependent methyltransferase